MLSTCIRSQSPAQNTNHLKKVWQTLTEQSCPHTYNFHMHTVCSDGKLQPEALMGQALNIGLKGLAITDHHSVQGYRRGQAWLENMQYKHPSQPLPSLWTGVEIHAILLDTTVHILGYGFDPDHPSLQLYLQGHRLEWGDPSAEAVIEAIHQAGGLAVLAHPARYKRSAVDLIPVAVELGIDGVEAYYAYRNPNPWTPSSQQTRQVKHLAAQFDLFTTCGTDTHGLNLLQRL